MMAALYWEENLCPTKSHFKFIMNDDDFEEHTHGLVPTTTALDGKKCLELCCVVENSN